MWCLFAIYRHFGPDDNFVNKLRMVARMIDVRMALCAPIGHFFQASVFVQQDIFRYSTAQPMK